MVWYNETDTIVLLFIVFKLHHFENYTMLLLRHNKVSLFALENNTVVIKAGII